MRSVALGVAVLALGVGPAAVAAPPEDEGWTFVHELDDGLRIFRRSRPGEPAGIPEVRIRVRVPLSVGALRAVLTDYAHVEDFIPHVKSSSVVQAGPDWALVRQRLAFPPVLAMREYMIRLEIGGDGGGWEVRWEQVPLPAPPDDAVEPRALWGSWRLEPRGKGTEVVYTVFMDPGGRVPEWLVRIGMDGYLPRVVRAVLARARAPGGRRSATFENRAVEGR